MATAPSRARNLADAAPNLALAGAPKTGGFSAGGTGTPGTPASVSEPAQVPFTRMDYSDPALLEELLGAVREVAERGAFTLGHHVESFERDFAAYCEADFAVGVGSGTEALALALRALDVAPGDEVIVPANSFIATAEAVSAVGAIPKPADVDPDSHLITAENVQACLGPRVRCVIPVHLFGATVDMDPILALGREAGVHVLEDACQAHGARYRGRRVGTLGTLGCFSFYPGKNLGAWGDGGAVVTAVPELADRLRLLRSHGERPRYHHRVVGSTARLDALQAAVLRRKLTRLEGWNQDRRRLGTMLRTRLAGTVDPAHLPFSGADHVYHLFVVRSPLRDALREHLASEGVASAIHYPVPIHRTEAYAMLGLGPGRRPISEALAEQICSLPIFPSMTERELEQVVGAVESFTQDESVQVR
jgi:dTDP-3-amino-3,4,6-trideoxy-alpha-D-glucose transaminase